MLRTLGDSIGDSGGMEITLGSGEKLRLRQLNMEDLGRFEKWMEGRALSSLQVMRDKVDTTTYAEMVGAVAGQIAAGKFAFGGQACNEAMRSVPGGVKILSMISGVPEAKAKEILISDGDLISEGMKLVVNRSMPESAEGPEGNRKGE